MDLLDKMTSAMGSVDEEQGRVYGCLTGRVTDIDTKLMRVKARIGKQEDSASTDWLLPMLPGSIESLPETDEMVGVIFADGDVHRGFYFYFPQSTTKNRPSEAMMLGLVTGALYNDLVAKVNQLIIHFFAHGHVESGGVTAAPSMAVTGAALVPATIGAAGKIQKADGSTVSAQGAVTAAGSDAKALSKRGLVR